MSKGQFGFHNQTPNCEKIFHFQDLNELGDVRQAKIEKLDISYTKVTASISKAEQVVTIDEDRVLFLYGLVLLLECLILGNVP